MSDEDKNMLLLLNFAHFIGKWQNFRHQQSDKYVIGISELAKIGGEFQNMQ